MEEADLHLDGNAVAGQLAAIFSFDITVAEAVCSGCGAVGPIGALAAYGLEMGVILRCQTCDTALIRISRLERGSWLDLRGVRVMRVPAATT